MATDKPNVVYIMADQMSAPLLKMYDKNSVIKTPNLDRLEKDAVVFESAYCNSPLCAPSRFTMCTGQLPSKIGGYDNAADFAADTPTYAHYLRQQGYHTALAGKMHFCGPDQLHGFEERLTPDIYPGDYGWSVNWDEPEVRPDWYHSMHSVMESGPIARTNQLDFDEEVVYKSTQWIFDHARKRPNQPFSLTMSLTHPHDPYEMTRDFWDMYEDVDIPMPSTPAFAHDEQDPHSQRILKCVDLYGKTMPENKIRDARRAYFAACTYVDHNIGKLLKTLDACGLSDNTIIVFSGDHGDMLGERGLWYKMSFFEHSARVPMLVYGPGRFSSRRVTQNVSTMDLMPTFVEMVGSKVHPSLPVDGISLMPHIAPEIHSGAKSDTVIGEYMGEGTVAPLVMIRRGKWKFVYCPTDAPQLFNLEEDPLERNNLAKGTNAQLPAIEPKSLAPSTSKPITPPRTPSQNSQRTDSGEEATTPVDVKKVLKSFLEETAARWDFEKITADVIMSQRRRRLVHSALLQGQYKAWEYVTPDDPTKKYVRNHGGQGVLGDFEDTARFPYPAGAGLKWR